MSRFVIEGVVVSAPVRETYGATNREIVKLTLESRRTVSDKTYTDIYEIRFLHSCADEVKKNFNYIGACVTVIGRVSSKEYNGKRFYDLNGERMVVMSLPNPEAANPNTSYQANSYHNTPQYQQPTPAQQPQLGPDGMPYGIVDDDLPF